MNMRLAKEEIALLLPTSLSNYTAEPLYSPANENKGFFAHVRAALRWIAELPERHAVLMELNEMTDRELADIGLQRNELAHVFDPEFKREDVRKAA